MVTGRRYGNAHAASASFPEERQGRAEHMYVLARQELDKVVVLAAGKPMHRHSLRLVPRLAQRHVDAPRGQEAQDAVEARLAVDIAAIIGFGVEGDEWNASFPRMPAEELIKQLLPGARVERCRLCDHAVEVENEGPELFDVDVNHVGCHDDRQGPAGTRSPDKRCRG